MIYFKKTFSIISIIILGYCFIQLSILLSFTPITRHYEIIFDEYKQAHQAKFIEFLVQKMGNDSIAELNLNDENFLKAFQLYFELNEDKLNHEQTFSDIRRKLFKGLYYQYRNLLGRQIWGIYHFDAQKVGWMERTIFPAVEQQKINNNIKENIIHLAAPDYSGNKKIDSAYINSEFQFILLYIIGWGITYAVIIYGIIKCIKLGRKT